MAWVVSCKGCNVFLVSNSQTNKIDSLFLFALDDNFICGLISCMVVNLEPVLYDFTLN